MNNIKSLDLLIKTINENFKKNDNVKILNNIVNNYVGDDWKKYISIGSGYIKQKIYSNDLYEIYGITWNPNSESKIHDHSENGCIFNILDGNLKEELFDTKLKLHKINYYNSSNKIGINNNEFYHKVSNISNTTAFSLHIYSPPNYKMNTFN